MKRAPMNEPAICLPLGFGLRGEPTTIRWDGSEYEVIPFRIEMPGIRIVERSEDFHSLIDSPPGGTEVMIRRDHGLADGLRAPMSEGQAERVMTILEASAGEVATWEPIGRSATSAAAKVCTSRDPEPIARFLRLIRATDRTLAFGERTIVRRLGWVLLTELAHVRNDNREKLRSTLAEKIGRPWTQL